MPRSKDQNTLARVVEPSVLDRLKAENARRVGCSECELMILPELMARHVRICHEW